MAQPPGSDTRASWHTGDQRADNPEAGAHLGDKFIGRGGVDNLAGGQVQRLTGEIILAVDRLPLTE